jgi:predicted transposase YdaD
MGAIDQAFKRLLQEFAQAILQYIFGNVSEVTPLPSEIAIERQLLPDTFFRASIDEIACVVNTEVQTEPDKTMPQRCYEYAARAWLAYRLPVLSVVIYVYPRGPITPGPFQMNVGRWPSGLWNIYNVELYKLTPNDLLNPGLPGLLPLVPLTKGATWAEAEEAMRRVAAVQPVEAAKVLGNALGILLGDATGQKEQANELFWRYFMTFYERMLEGIPWLHEALEKGREEGREEGKAEGLSVGELLGMREVALRTLANRFELVPDEIEIALQAADKERLLDVATHAGTDTLDQVRARLGLAEQQS